MSQSPNIDYEAIRKRAEDRVKTRQGFYVHLGIFVVVNIFVWVLLAAIQGTAEWIRGVDFLALVTSLLWGLGLAIHGVVVMTMFSGRTERAIQREIERE